mgnify:CR=1 FL=1
MAKFLSYEDRLEIQNGLKEHLTFTEIGKKLGRDRTTITKEVRNYSVEQDTGYSVFPPLNTCKYRKGCRRKKVCGTYACKHPLVPACRQCELLCNTEWKEKTGILLQKWKFGYKTGSSVCNRPCFGIFIEKKKISFPFK